jgi:predicted metal-dependent TIM-barrel fold hydrolase
MKTIIIHHVNEDFTNEYIETITMIGGTIRSIKYTDTKPL